MPNHHQLIRQLFPSPPFLIRCRLLPQKFCRSPRQSPSEIFLAQLVHVRLVLPRKPLPPISVKEDLEDVKSSALSAGEVKSESGAAQAKAPEVAGKFHMSGKFVTSIHWNSSSSAEAVNALFDEAKKKALGHVRVDKT